MSPRSRDEALIDLLLDVQGADDPPLEWLVQYARDRGSLGAEERAAVERRLGESATYAEELRALERFGTAAPSPAAVVARAPSLLARLRAALAGIFELPGIGGFGLAAAAAAAVLLAIYGVGWRGRAPGQPAGPGPVVAERPELPPSAPAPEREAVEPVPPEPPQAGAPAAKPPVEPAPEPEKATPPPKPGRIMLAMALPAYRAPEGAIELGAHGGIIRGAGDSIELEALAPAHAGLSSTPAPELFWTLAALPPAGAGRFELLVQDPDSPDPLLEVLLDVTQPGVQRVSLAEHGVALAPSIDYAWSVAFRTDPQHPSRDPFARGWVRYEPAPAPLAGLSPAEAPRALAEAGYWYDALAAVRAALDAQPDNASVRAAWDALLEGAALEAR